MIPANGFLVIECDKEGLHADPVNYPSWGLSKNDEIIVLADADFNVIDEVTTPSLSENETYGRKTVFIPNGVNKPKIVEPNLIQQKFDLNKDDYILYLGRIVPEKGIHYLIEAYNQIKTEKKLVIAGGSSDTDEYFEKLKTMANNNKNIIFTGFVQGQILDELYSNAYIYCLPSDLEGMPLSLLEAMSYGNCCLVSDIEECTSVIEDKGISFKKGNVQDLQETLDKLLKDKERVEKLSSESSDYICQKYSWDTVTKKTLDLY